LLIEVKTNNFPRLTLKLSLGFHGVLYEPNSEGAQLRDKLTNAQVRETPMIRPK
jgi:hypothetical protein